MQLNALEAQVRAETFSEANTALLAEKDRRNRQLFIQVIIQWVFLCWLASNQ
jgi:hypothetical protein